MNIPVQNGQLPQGFCATDYQTLLNAFTAVQFVPISLVTSFIVSPTPPTDTTAAWQQVDANGRPVRIYVFAQGAWLSPHPLPPGFTMIWPLVLPNFQTFDGGDTNSAPWTALSGQMWQLAATTTDGQGTQILGGTAGAIQGGGTVFGSSFPVGVGTFTSQDAVALGATGGEEGHQLKLGELAGHTHFIANVDNGNQSSPQISPVTSMNLSQSADSAPSTDYILRGTATVPTLGLSSPAGAAINSGNPLGLGNPHNTLPPFCGVYFLQRTNRLFYVVPA